MREQPFVLAGEAPGGLRIVALNEATEAFRLAAGDLVADARARVGGVLQVRPADPAADEAALRRLALWATRYTPASSPWDGENGSDGFFLEVTGSAHLFGGEEGLLADLSKRLDRFGLSARMAIADTAGMAWALSHFHPSPSLTLDSFRAAESLATLPIEALRLPPETSRTLRRLGFKRVGSLLDKPRAPLAARFPSVLLKRLDQALGRIPEPLTFITPAPTYHVFRQLLEPIATQEAIVIVAALLMQDLVPVLARDGVGARSLQLVLYRIDGEVVSVGLGLTAPTNSPDHVARLIGLKLDRVADTVDAGFGFEAAGLMATVVERMDPRQSDLSPRTGSDAAEHRVGLIDKLKQRLGPHRVWQLEPVASHLPEIAQAKIAPAAKLPVWPAPDQARPRPILLLQRPEPVEAVTNVPGGPPKLFCWRGKTHSVADAQGPERIADEWWRQRTPQPTRDYYLIQGDTGHRFWLYREGPNRETTEPRWFVHGLFG